jgi:hypothetical protein
MKKLPVVLALGAVGAGIGLAGCGAPAAAGGAASSSPAAASRAADTARGPAQAASQSSTAAPAVTQTVTRVQTVSAAPASRPAAPATAAQTPQAPAAQPAAQPPGGPNVTDPWAVVSAYYGDVDSGAYAQAYALIGNGATTGQSYQQFADGYACTGGQQVSENWESGDQVNFSLAAVDSCTGVTQYYTGTDTVENGTIVGADIAQTG